MLSGFLLAAMLWLGLRFFRSNPALNTYHRAKSTVKEQILEIPVASVVEVRLKDGNKLLGWLREVSSTGFEIEIVQTKPDEHNRARQIDFSQVESIRYPAKAQTDMGEEFQSIAVFAVIGVVVVILFILIRVIRWW
jgi:hypothetical protein